MLIDSEIRNASTMAINQSSLHLADGPTLLIHK